MNFLKKVAILFFMTLYVCHSVAWAEQKSDITVEDIWQKNTFAVKSVYGVNWMKDGRYYSSEVADPPLTG